MGSYTDFGYERVEEHEKARRVRAVFDSVSGRYDLMNDLMSLGVHRLWKRFAVFASAARPGARVLDLAAGTGDLTRLLSERVGAGGMVVGSDVNASMLGEGRRRLTDAGVVGNVCYLQCDAQCLPFAPRSFDLVTMAFGLRNVTHKQQALRAAAEVLRPGGQLVVLEFSQLRLAPLRRLYDLYSFRVLPWIGARVAGDAQSYRYLAESIRVHPDQETLRDMMVEAGFERCDYLNLSAGIVAVHRGYRL